MTTSSPRMWPIFTWLGGRRLALCIGCAAINTVLVWFGKIDATTYKDIIQWTVVAYIGGNTWEATKSARPSDADTPAG